MDPYALGGFSQCPFNNYLHSVGKQNEANPISEDEEGNKT